MIGTPCIRCMETGEVVNKICYFYIFIIGKRPTPFNKIRLILTGIGIM